MADRRGERAGGGIRLSITSAVSCWRQHDFKHASVPPDLKGVREGDGEGVCCRACVGERAIEGECTHRRLETESEIQVANAFDALLAGLDCESYDFISGPGPFLGKGLIMARTAD
jgi:hypothetical protein